MDNKYKRLAKNTFWTLIGNTGSKLLGFLLLPLYTRWLGTAGFGESDLVITYSSFLVCIMTMCVADGIFVFTKNQGQGVKKIYFSSSLLFIGIMLLFWAVVWVSLEIVFDVLEVKNSFANNLWLIFGMVVSTFIQQFSQQFVLSLEKIKIYSFTGILYSLLTLLFSYWLIPQIGVRGYILAVIYANLLTGSYSFLFSKSYQYLSFRKFEKGKIYELLKYSIPLIPNGVMWWLVSALNRPVMEYNLDYSAIGIFAVANRFPGIITMVFTVFSVAWNISVFEEYGKDGYEDFYKKIFRMLFLSIIIVASIIIFSSELMISIFAAPEFHEAWKYMIVMIVTSFISCLSSFFGTNFGVVKQSKYFFYSSIWGAATAIVFNIILIPFFGIWGATFSGLLSFVVMMSSRYIYSLKFVSTPLLYYVLIYVLTLGIIAAIVLFIGNIYLKFLLSILLLSVLLYKERDILKPIVNTFSQRICK